MGAVGGSVVGSYTVIPHWKGVGGCLAGTGEEEEERIIFSATCWVIHECLDLFPKVGSGLVVSLS